jgi:colicin import membrane protein
MASRPRPPQKPRASRTRADVNEAYENLASAQSGEALDPQAVTLAAEHAKRTRAAVAGLSVDAIVQKSATLGLDISRTLSGLTEQCVEKAKELKTLEDAVTLESEELHRLYDLDTVSASIQLLLQVHEEKKVELEKEQETARAQWTEERVNYTKRIKEADALQAQERQRENNDFVYRRDTERARLNDDFNEKVRVQEREQADKLTLFNKDIATRRLAIETEEKEIAALRVRVAGIDEEIKKEVDKATKIVAASVTKDLTNAHILEKKDLDHNLQLERRNTQSLTEANTKLAEQIVKLQASLDAAKEQVQSIAVKALESASGQQALQRVTDIVKENGSVGRTGKS